MVSGGVPGDFHGQYVPQVKEKLLLNVILCLVAGNRTKQIQRCNNQANEL